MGRHKRSSRKSSGSVNAATIYRRLPKYGKALWQLATPAQRAELVRRAQGRTGGLIGNLVNGLIGLFK